MLIIKKLDSSRSINRSSITSGNEKTNNLSKNFLKLI